MSHHHAKEKGRGDVPLTARQVRMGQRLCILAGSLGSFWGNIVNGIPVTMLLEALQSSGRLMGLATSLRYAPLMLQLPGALLVESMPARKRPWGVLLLVQRSLWFIPAFALLLRASDSCIILLTIAVGAMGAALDALGTASWQSWITDLVPEHQRGQFWSTRSFFCTFAMLLAVLFGGITMDRGAALGGDARYVAFGIVFLAAAISGFSDIVVHLFVPEPAPVRSPRGESILSRICAPLRDRNFRYFTMGICAWNFACSLTCLNQVYLRQEFGMTYTTMGLTMVIRSVGSIGAGLLLGRAIDRIGSRSFLIAMTVVAPIFPLSWMFLAPGTVQLPLLGSISTVTLLISVESFVSGITYAAVGLAQTTLLGKLSPRQGRTLSIAFFGTFVGIVAAAGALLAGLLSDAFNAAEVVMLGNARFSYPQCSIVLCNLVVFAVCIPFLARVRPPTETHTVRHAFASLFAVNPWRLTAGLYHLRILDAATAPKEQAAAVSHITASTRDIAVSDLSKKLDDPDIEVREAAVDALGRLGTEESVQALLRELEAPDTDLATCILRTLRHRPTPACLEKLVRFVEEGTPDQRREATRALGVLGDARAAECLRRTLVTSTDPTLLSDTGTALSRLRDSGAVYDLLPRFHQAKGTVLRRSLAVAIANLLTRPDAFYRTMKLEEQAEGMGFDHLVREMVSHFRRLCRDDRTTRRLPMVLARIHRVQEQVEEGRFGEATEGLLGVARCFAAIARRMPASDDSAVEALVWSEPRYAAGYWFLSQLRASESAQPDRLETLLALQLLADWTARG